MSRITSCYLVEPTSEVCQDNQMVLYMPIQQANKVADTYKDAIEITEYLKLRHGSFPCFRAT